MNTQRKKTTKKKKRKESTDSGSASYSKSSSAASDRLGIEANQQENGERNAADDEVSDVDIEDNASDNEEKQSLRRPVGGGKVKKRKTELILEKVAMVRTHNRFADAAEHKNQLLEKMTKIAETKSRQHEEKNMMRLFKVDLEAIPDEAAREFFSLKRQLALVQLRKQVSEALSQSKSVKSEVEK